MTVAAKLNFFPQISHTRNYNHNHSHNNRKRWGQDKHRETSYGKNSRSRDPNPNPFLSEMSMRSNTFSQRNHNSQIHRNYGRKRPFSENESNDRPNRYENKNKNNYEYGQRNENKIFRKFKSAHKLTQFHQQKKSDYDSINYNQNYSDKWKDERKKPYRAHDENDDHECNSYHEINRSKTGYGSEEKGRNQWNDQDDEDRDMKRSGTIDFNSQCKDNSGALETSRRPCLKRKKFIDAESLHKAYPLNQNFSLSTPRIARHNKVQKTKHTNIFNTNYSIQSPVKFYKNKIRSSHLKQPMSKYSERRNRSFRDYHVRNQIGDKDHSYRTQSNIVSSSSSLPRSLPSPNHSTTVFTPGGARSILRMEKSSHPSHKDTIIAPGDAYNSPETKLYPEHKVTSSSSYAHLQVTPRRELEEGEEDEEKEEGEIVNENDKNTGRRLDKFCDVQGNNDPIKVLRKGTRSLHDVLDNQSKNQFPQCVSLFESRWEPAPGSNYSQTTPYTKKSFDANKKTNLEFYPEIRTKSTFMNATSEKIKLNKIIEDSPTICSLESGGDDCSKKEEDCKNMKDKVLSDVEKNGLHKTNGDAFAKKTSNTGTTESISIENSRKESSILEKYSKIYHSNEGKIPNKNQIEASNMHEDSSKIDISKCKRLFSAENTMNKKQAHNENDLKKTFIKNKVDEKVLNTSQEKNKESVSTEDTKKYEKSKSLEDFSTKQSLKSFNMDAEHVKEDKKTSQSSSIIEDLFLKESLMDAAHNQSKEKSNKKKSKLRITISKQKLKASSCLPSLETNPILVPASETISCTENALSSVSVSQSDSSILSRTNSAREAQSCLHNEKIHDIELIEELDMKSKQCVKHDIDFTRRNLSGTTSSLSDRIVDEDDTSFNTSPSIVNTRDHNGVISQVSPISLSSSKTFKIPNLSTFENTDAGLLRSKDLSMKPGHALMTGTDDARKSVSLPKKKRFMAAMQEQVSRNKWLESNEQIIPPNVEGPTKSVEKKSFEKCISTASNENLKAQVQSNKTKIEINYKKHPDRNPFSSSSSSSSSSSDASSSTSEEDLKYSDESSCALSDMSSEEEDSLDENFAEERDIHNEEKVVSYEHNATSHIKKESEGTMKSEKLASHSFQNRLNAMVLSSFHLQEDELNKKMKKINKDLKQESEKHNEINVHKKSNNSSSELFEGESDKNKSINKTIRYKKIKRNISKPDIEDILPKLQSKKNPSMQSQVTSFANPRFKITTSHEVNTRSKLPSRKWALTKTVRGGKTCNQRNVVDHLPRFKMPQSKSNMEIIPRFKIPLPSKESTIIPRFKLPPKGNNKTTAVNKRQKISKLKKKIIVQKKKRDSSDEDDSYTTDENVNDHWVRRSVRTPCKSVLRNRHVKLLLMKLRNNDSDMQVLKLKKFIGPDTPTIVMDAILDRLMENSNCQALYIQVCNKLGSSTSTIMSFALTLICSQQITFLRFSHL